MRSTLPEQPDILLLEECRKGNTRAYDVLFDRYSGKLYHYALKYIRDEARAEEAMMDLMFWLWDKRHQLEPDIQLGPYLFRAMKHAIIKVLTRNQTATVPLDLAGDTSVEDAANRLRENELSELYQEKLNALSQQRQKVFRLSRHENLSHAEIAKEMNLSLFTVKNHIKASLTYLRTELKEYIDITGILVLIFIS
ncbi:RNA polymerase sigma-70 factor, ECF subfamily [Chitinophaga terrae (ex Kim and Jung 2007)]|jgi:RNA polymerase sigma-70 factor (ECF subfamily)|uniref:RNA polymerase sigma-70 factor, ECF subfamily n=1 Tax=Chitinophaga terrae (ex Kim and Jung 2007) TaxID=408074 RepID=A0A1H4EHD4_9BACT|nr:RNA polymerase sigma-70 factor [Chitinophaga terrae (ex Kim and Jung 2007)]MDQ0106540.1 RNA polymerase sigma-70 factor (ECF subfamily) [Chitinophaga terrae (ex Kim and Jung 2007)]GEP91653.1 RNA polymerase sigma factor [Chitinophaga terrae (ex Kim and Jung 2007)]SEA84445.1 RNA polymerase sigma-70 factor, ECF subfamily [Chitinophaga terrae (ex Kim and Jung 2007)]